MGKVSGRCYYKMTVNGNLWGEYSNYKEKNIYAESATRVDGNGSEHNWVGEYQSTWREEKEADPVGATLEIKPCPHNAKLFIITWTRDGKQLFHGEAMLCDDILVVDYTSCN